MTTQIDSANIPIAMDLSSLATSSTLTTGVNSTEVQNSAGYVDALVTVLPIIGGATAPAAGQLIGLYIAGQNVSFATNPIAGIDGSAGSCILTYGSTLNSLRMVGWPTVTNATGGLPYIIEPFSVAQQFGCIMPKFWCLFLAHNHTGSLAAAQSALFSYNGITY